MVSDVPSHTRPVSDEEIGVKGPEKGSEKKKRKTTLVRPERQEFSGSVRRWRSSNGNHKGDDPYTKVTLRVPSKSVDEVYK